MKQNLITGIDIGGTHITVCLVNPESGTFEESTLTRHAVDPSLDAKSIISGWAKPVKESWARAGVDAARIGIAMPGPFDYENGISLIKGLSKYEALYELPVKDMFAAALGIAAADIRMVNDATAYVRGECGMGCAKGDNNVLGITLGTGLGSALYRNGALEDGDLYCYPFRNATAEDFISARWFLNTYEQRTGMRLKGVKDLAELAETDEVAKNMFTEFGETLAAVISTRYSSQMPSTIVVGGNIARASGLFLPVAKQKLGLNCEWKLAVLGEKAALIGAAFLWAGE